MSLDTTYTINTPEGILLKLSPVGLVSRMWAWLLDVVIRLVIYLILFSGLGSAFDMAGIGVAFVGVFFIEWFYPVYFELKKKGQTPGKKWLGIYVAHEDGTPISPGASLTRNLLRFVDFLPFMYGFGLVSMAVSRKFQRLGDFVAGTVVLHHPKKRQAKDDTHLNKEIVPTPPAFPLSLKEQQAVINFAQRSSGLSEERNDELAKVSGEWVAGIKNPAAYLIGVAKWLQGER